MGKTAACLIVSNKATLDSTNASLIAALQEFEAKQGYGEILAVVVGDQHVDSLAKQLASFALSKVVAVKGPVLSAYTSLNFKPLVSKLVESLSIDCLLMAASSEGKDLLPRVSAELARPQVSELTEICENGQFKRLMYAGNVLATVEVGAEKFLATVRTTCFNSPVSAGRDCPVEEFQAKLEEDSRVKFESLEQSSGERPELSDASVVVSGGRALKSKEQFEAVLMPLVDLLGAAVGASRAAVDSGFAPNDWQVGQTGKIVAPDLYLAIGISGAIQHIAGMKGAKCIVAINNDPDAPIFDVCDYGLVADLFEAVPKLCSELEKHVK